MRPLSTHAWGWALTLLAASAGPSHAAWNNVFQVCCNNCGKSNPVPAVAGYGGYAAGYGGYVAGYGGGDCCQPQCPQPTCTTRYVQRCYYQPVTSYRTSYYYEPVTTYRTSYYYEPVCTYRYSCYYDPCTCSYQSVATPATSYQLRSRCCPVTSYLQRTCCTPVTSYQQAFYYEPVTSCCTSTAGAAVPAPPPGAATAPPSTSAAVVPAPPATSESREPAPVNPPPGTSESRDGAPMSETYKSERSPSLNRPGTMPPAIDSSYRPTPVAPAIRLDRIASRGDYNVEGRVVMTDRRPMGNTRVLLVSTDSKSVQRTVTTKGDGSFRASVTAGGWLVYTHDANGRPVFSRRIEIPSNKGVTMTLTHR